MLPRFVLPRVTWPRPVVPLVVLAVLVVGTSCASGRGSGDAADMDPAGLFLEPWRPPTGQSCSVSDDPLPALAAVFDSAAVARTATSIAESGVGGASLLSVQMRFAEPDSANPEEDPEHRVTIRVVESTHPERESRRIVEVLEREARAEVLRSAFLRVDTSPVRLRLGPGLACAPTMANRETLRLRVERAARDGVRGRVLVMIFVNEDGSSGPIEIREGSGNAAVDQEAARIAGAARFHPALVNRMPVAVWSAFPLTFAGSP